MNSMMQFLRCGISVGPRAGRSIAAAMLLVSAAATFDARAQTAVQGVPNAMQGFTQNRDQPI